jgi:hypothetical protein
MTVVIGRPQVPTGSRVTLKIEVTTDFNVSAFVAQQKTNYFLSVNAGNMLVAGDPELVIGDVLRWRVPVLFGTPVKGCLGKVGELLIDVDTGDVIVENAVQLEEMLHRAEVLYSGSTPAAGA